MYNYCKYEEKYQDQMYEIFDELTKEEVFFKELTKEEFKAHLFGNRSFTPDATFVALEGEKVVGYISGNVREMDRGNINASGFIHTIIVRKSYRNQGIGSKLLELLEDYFKSEGLGSSRFVFLGAVNWPWYIPNTNKHIHPGMPAVRMNSPFYKFLYKHLFFVNSIHEGFHLPLSEYTLPKEVVERMEKNKEHGLTVEVYDPNKHFGLEKFYENIKENAGFVNSIKSNLAREQPRPFLVAANCGQVVGWTGAMYAEKDGRGHLDGIIVDPNQRGGGLGKALFCNLCEYLKEHGATYMTFFTGIDNPARYIYQFAGFRVAQSFADMKHYFYKNVWDK